MTRKLINASLGFALGVITAPLVIVAWPPFAAWFMWRETERDEA